MLALSELQSPLLDCLPVFQVLTVLNEKAKQQKRAELWQHYMGNVITMLGEKGTKSFMDVLAEFDAVLQANKQADTQEAYDNADAVLEALENSRRGV